MLFIYLRGVDQLHRPGPAMSGIPLVTTLPPAIGEARKATSGLIGSRATITVAWVRVTNAAAHQPAKL